MENIFTTLQNVAIKRKDIEKMKKKHANTW